MKRLGIALAVLAVFCVGIVLVRVGHRRYEVHHKAVAAHELFNALYSKHETVLHRILTVESHIDGLAPEFRRLMNDQKDPWAWNLKEDGKRLPDGLLTLALVSERKRMESEVSFLNTLAEHPQEQERHLRTVVSWLLRLDATNLLVTYAEKMDSLNRSSTRQIAAINSSVDPEKEKATMKFAAATLTLEEYTKEKKETLYLARPELVALATHGKLLLTALESGFGKLGEDALIQINSKLPVEAQTKLRVANVERTVAMVRLCDKLEQGIWEANQKYAEGYIANLRLATQEWNNYRAHHKTR